MYQLSLSLPGRRAVARGAFLMMLGLFGIAPMAMAEIPPAFTVADIPVDATADNSVAARAAGLAEGEAAAFRQLLERMTQPGDAARLSAPDASALTNLVADYQVSNEHSSAVRYIATYTFRFNPKSVRDYLHGLGVAFTELASRPVVIVPVLTIGDASHLWDDPNPWRDAWNAQPGQSGLVPWVMPAGDIQDVSDFDVANAAQPSADKLAALSGRYGGGDVVVANAIESEVDGEPHLAITLTRYNDSGTTTHFRADASADTLNAAFYQMGVQAAARALEAGWKGTTFSAPSADDQTVELSVPMSGIADWGRVRSRLADVPIIHQVNVDFMSRREVRMSLKYAGDPQALKIALAQQNLTMIDGDPYPTIQARPMTDPAPAATPSSQN